MVKTWRMWRYCRGGGLKKSVGKKLLVDSTCCGISWNKCQSLMMVTNGRRTWKSNAKGCAIVVGDKDILETVMHFLDVGIHFLDEAMLVSVFSLRFPNNIVVFPEHEQWWNVTPLAMTIRVMASTEVSTMFNIFFIFGCKITQIFWNKQIFGSSLIFFIETEDIPWFLGIPSSEYCCFFKKLLLFNFYFN